MMMENVATKKNNTIEPFLTDEGKIRQVPVPNKKKISVLAYLSNKFQQERVYSEKEVNQIINQWHTFNDYFLLRRLLVDYKFLARTPNGAKYWLTPEKNEKGEN